MNAGRRCSNDLRWASNILTAILFAFASPTFAQDEGESNPFAERSSDSAPTERPAWFEQVLRLEQRFFDAEDWTFYRSIDGLPSDLQAALYSVAGDEVVDAGESFNESDIHRFRGNTQHIYSAEANDIGVLVWYVGGWTAGVRVLILDRGKQDAVRYNLGQKTGPALPLRGTLRDWIRMRAQEHVSFEYLPAGFFTVPGASTDAQSGR